MAISKSNVRFLDRETGNIIEIDFSMDVENEGNLDYKISMEPEEITEEMSKSLNFILANIFLESLAKDDETDETRPVTS